MRTLQMALVTETYPPEVNGVSLTVARFVQGLLARGHQVELVRPHQPRARVNLAGADGYGMTTLECPGLPIPMYPDLRLGLPMTRRLIRHWSVRRPQLVHVATEGPLGWSAVRAANRLGIPVTSDFRTNFHAYARHYRLGWLQQPILGYLRRLHNRTLQTLVPTASMLTELAAQGFDNLCVVGRGVDLELFSPSRRCGELRRQWRISEQTIVLLYVGRLAAEKNLPLLFETYRTLRGRGLDVQLVLVGDGPERTRLTGAYPDVIFTGQQRGAALAAHFASADLFLFPSQTETFGNVVIEAMASGLPVVAFNAAAAALLVRPAENGLLADAGRAEQFVAHAGALAGAPERLQAMRQQARNAAGEWSWSRVIQQFEAVLLLHSGQRVGTPERTPQNTALVRNP